MQLKNWLGNVIFESAVETVQMLLIAALASGANLRGADLCGANLRGADLCGADLRGADLCGANLRGADLRGANLYGADLRGANLYGADLYGADLRGADLRGADLRGADLCGADLRADLRGADLRGANLRGANLRGADLQKAKLPAPTVVLLASWGEVAPQLCADLMVFDASCHPEPAKFDVWANGGECPYSGVAVERAAQFKESKEIWNQKVGVICRPYDLMMRLINEKCPVWTEEQRIAFEVSFKKVE